MGKLPFSIERHSTIDKSFLIRCNVGDIKIIVDFDDVDHKEVNELARRIVDTLNENWDCIPAHR